MKRTVALYSRMAQETSFAMPKRSFTPAQMVTLGGIVINFLCRFEKPLTYSTWSIPIVKLFSYLINLLHMDLCLLMLCECLT